MKARVGTLAGCLLASVPGCASELASNELVSARTAYQQARASRAASFSRERLGEARRALDRAEGAHLAASGAPEARALAYVALRRSELARLAGDYEFDVYLVAELRERERLAAAPSQAAPAVPSESGESPPPSSGETSANESAEPSPEAERADEAQAFVQAVSGMEPLVLVKSEEERTLLTLDSSFVFVPKKAEIAPGARERLDRIAQALAKLGDESSIAVVGHTDSTGPDASNLELSKRRAEALRAYLVSRGVAADRIHAEGKGEQKVASNDTPEGRALNRRIEIVIVKTGEH